MRLKVIIDNNTIIDSYYWGEPGVSYFIEDEGSMILFDMGYSDLVLRNLIAMGIEPKTVDTIVLSHGHDDHTKGLKPFFENVHNPGIKLIAHPDVFNEKEADGLKISAPFSELEMAQKCRLTLSKSPVKLSENITFLGEIPRKMAFEKQNPIGRQQVLGKWEADFIWDDSGLVYQCSDGIVVITGCSHSGICNIIEQAKAITGEDRVLGVIGGFHLFTVTDQVHQTIDYFKKNKITDLYPCHCTSFAVKAAIHTELPIHDVGVGLELNW
ncbi:MBL fold metallo-hydrolase [Acetobacterium bakii]|uniref:Beta-lactamase n=1 Tax=Acetobacterium bakii TaxID=52689 RepID=A0A0L6TXY1_9FIRM|nr:MBL fold metallo-hydrolase [Acetobacterium bakii]KNZ40415.1 beta-lactamase [Acetobacterium bakii]